MEEDEIYSLDLVGMRLIVKVHISSYFPFQLLGASFVDFNNNKTMKPQDDQGKSTAAYALLLVTT